MIHSVYSIKSIHRNYIYVGMTTDLERRLKEHNRGYSKTTKPYAPFEVILIEEFETRAEARAREIFLKTTSGKRFLRKLLTEKIRKT
jgi:putative endonuclease